MGRKKSCRTFKDFYVEWAETLRSTLLPLLRRSMAASASPSVGAGLPMSQLGGGAAVASSDILAANVHALHGHFQAYLRALDLAARSDPSQIISPSFRSPLSLPFLFLGDFHPSLLTTLLRSFLANPSRDTSLPLPFALAWQNPSKVLTAKIEQVERGLRLMVPSLTKRFRDAQAGFAEAFAAEWAAVRCKEGGEPSRGEQLEGAVRERMEELASVVLDANRLRRRVLAEIVGAADVHQAALYLEALAQFVVGLRDPDLLREFEQCRTPLSPASV